MTFCRPKGCRVVCAQASHIVFRLKSSLYCCAHDLTGRVSSGVQSGPAGPCSNLKASLGRDAQPLVSRSGQKVKPAEQRTLSQLRAPWAAQSAQKGWHRNWVSVSTTTH